MSIIWQSNGGIYVAADTEGLRIFDLMPSLASGLAQNGDLELSWDVINRQKLQYTTDLSGAVWQDYGVVEKSGRLTVPFSTQQSSFFRLVKP